MFDAPAGAQMSFFPSEAEQIQSIAEAESVTPSAFSMFISQDDIDHILRAGGNADAARMKIAAEFSKQKPLEDCAAFLKALYYGGNGLITDNGRLSAWYGDDGIHIATGDTSRYLRSAQVIGWADAAERIEELLDGGAFATNLEVTEAPRYERLGIAVDVWNLYHDFSDEAKSLGYLSCLGNIHSTSFPEETERLTDDLLNPEFRERLLAEHRVFLDAYRENRELLRFHFHRPQALLTRMEDLSLPRKEYHSDMAAVPKTGRFITEDEIAASLANGSGFEGGKTRIHEFFQTPHTTKESADFLKKEYGIGGRTHAVSRESGSYEDHGSKGIVLKKNGCADIQMNWNKVASRISELVRLNRYLTPDEQAAYDKEMAQDAMRNAVYNDYNDVKAAHPDEIVLYQVGDFFELYGEDARAVVDDLSLELTRRNLEGVGRVTMCGFPAKDLEKYVEKLREKHDVTISRIGDSSHKHTAYTLPSIDHEAEQAINAYEAEFGADGTRVFRDPAAELPPQPTVRELFDGYKLTVGNSLSKDTAFVNACRNSDRQNAYLEGADAIRRIVMASDDLQLVRLYFDMPAFHNRLHQELLEELYPTLAATVAPSPYQITQEDIDNALLDWHDNLKGKQEVALYMQAHGRERSTAAWLAAKYGWEDSKTPMYIHVGNAEPVTLTWAQVQRRLAQLIRENKFYDENERLRLFSPDRYSIRLHPGEGGITGIWDEVLERFCGDGEQTLRFAEQNNAIAYLDGIKRDMGIELSPPAFTTPLGYTYHIGDRISSIELDHIAAVGVIARVDEDYVWHTLPNAPGQEPVSIDRNSFERYLDTRYFEVSEPEPQRVIAAQHTEQPTPETPQAVQTLMGQRVEIDGKLYNVDSADETVAHLSVVSSSSESNHEPEHRTEPVSAVLTRIADQGRELAPNISAYQALRAEHPEKLIGVRVGERLLFYGADAKRAASALNRRLLQRDIPGMGETSVTGYDFGQWASGAKRLLEHGHSFVFAQPNETDGYDVINEADAKEYIPIGMELEIDGRKFVIDSVNFGTDEVSLRDVTFQNRQGFPIFRAEHIAFIRSFVEEQEREQPQPVTKPVAFYPAEKTHLPYDIEIQTLHIPEPEHDPPSAEPAEPEPPAMSDEERLILEQEGRAALSEMGEFVPDFDDAISQAEIDEPPAHRPAVSIPVDGEWQGFPSVAAAEQAAYADFKAASHRDAQNFHITDDALGVGGAKAKFRANMAAIRLLQELEFEGLQASPEQQEILSRYVGWGGLADCFDEKHSGYGELKALLSEDEYASARESTLTAFYTPPTVIRGIYQALENMSFKTGNILEPSCGIGHFIGMLPDSMESSRLYGVELDNVSGRIAQQLYQKSSVAVQGFEKTDLPDSFFDAAIGNVPFGQFKVPDKKYDKHNWLIHDYFFGRTLDKVRPGGIIAFVTSKGTLDKENPAVRKYIAQRADLLGAIRLPNNTFKSAAGTEVTSDIIFLQKRDRLVDIEPDWVHLGKDENGVVMNQYFINNPEMILGEMQMVSGQFGPESACVPYEGQELGALLSDAIQNIHAEVTDYEISELEEAEEDRSIPADPAVRNFSFTLEDGKLYYRVNSRMNPVEVSVTAENRIKGMIAIRDCVRTLIEYQTEDYPDSEIREQQEKLNALYDDFSKKYGLISSRANNTAFSTDSSYCLLSSLEVLDDEGNFVRKADMFSKRTIKQRRVVTSVDTASEALSVSLSEKAKVDMAYMEQLTGKSEQEIFADLQGVIFLNPMHTSENDGHAKYLTADEYLSGNVREKLDWARRSAELYPQDYAANVQALEAVQPVDLTASEISVRLGATWLPTGDVEDFMFELFSTPRYSRWNIHVHFSEYTGEWNIEGKSYDRGNIKAYNTYGTSRINGYKIIEETLNLRDVRIFDYVEDAEGRKQAVLNRKETAIAQGKQELIKAAFADWIWKDPSRRERLCSLYNNKFNSNRAREYDGSFLSFAGINPEITLRKHQINAVARGMLGGNELLAHVVGAGKTYTMVAIAQESKRLGLCQKSLFVVPNHLTEQWASEYLQLYPSANILVATKKDFEAKNRKRFCGRIATGDYDAVIIGHSQFEKIPMSVERQRAILEQQLEEITNGIIELKANRGESFSVKQLEKSKKTVKQKLEKLNDQTRKDDLVTFEELGIDRLFIDEAHYYKNLAAFTKMRNVGGISQTEAMKSSDLYMKCRYLDELTGGRGVVFATGTPISNSMVEMYTMQKYLQYSTLRRNNLLHFDAWASTFGETVTAIELAPEGTGYRAKTRFAKFYNLPELIMMFREVADIQTADMLMLPVPKAIYHTVALKPSEQQKEMVASLSERAERVRAKMVDSSVDNMLLITNDGRKLALDQRLMNELLPDNETGKTAACAENVFEIWERTKEARSTQMVFCDLSTPHGDGKFNVYDDVRDKLIARGIPAEEIAYIHSAETEAKKKELFGKVRSGQIRVLLGSTQKMGAGTNVQQKLIALHHLDCPWRPADLQQREGRIVRQGNENPEVEIYSYVTENTFDAYLYQLVESKQKFIGQIMTSKSPVRSAEDVDEQALSYAEIKALATGNPHIKEKMDLDIDVSRLKLLKANHLSQRYALEDQLIKELPQKLRSLEERIRGYEADRVRLTENTQPNADGFSPMVIQGKHYAEKKDAGAALLAACKAMTSPEAVPLGQYRGFAMELSFDSFSREFKVAFIGELRHTVALGTDIFGNIQRLDNALEAFPDRLAACAEQLENTKTQMENAKTEVQKPFPQEAELAEKMKRLDELNILLNMDKRDNEIADECPDEGEKDAPVERSDRER